MNVIAANFPVIMRRDHWDGVPEYSLSPEYSLRFYRPGDAARWVEILRAAYGDDGITERLFERRFGNDEDELARRQLFLCDGTGTAIGTATAWKDDAFEDGGWGRVRAVALRPEFQGRQLMRPLLTTLCRRFRELGHERAFLDTSTKRLPAIRLYWRFGFRGHCQTETDAHIWRAVAESLNSHENSTA